MQKGDVVNSPDPAKIRTHEKRKRDRLRLLVLKTYSGGAPTCACCAERRLEFLSIDHINGCGSELRKTQGTGPRLYATLKRAGFPEGYRVLCHNCNMALGFYGYCPHTNLERAEATEKYFESLQRWTSASQVNESQVIEGVPIIPTPTPRFSEQLLTPAHHLAIRHGINVIHDALGMPHAVIYNELRRQFRVAKYDQIPDARWAEVVAWFRPRVELALRQGGSGQADPFADDDRPAQGRMF